MNSRLLISLLAPVAVLFLSSTGATAHDTTYALNLNTLANRIITRLRSLSDCKR